MRVRIEHGIRDYRDLQREQSDLRFWQMMGVFYKLFHKRPGPVIDKQYCVDVYLDLTEEEKHILDRFHLLPTVIDEIDYDKTFIDQLVTQHRDYLQYEGPEALRHSHREAKAIAEGRRAELESHYRHTVQEYLSNPFRKPVKDEGAAQVYISRVKAEVLPKLKELLDSHKTIHPESDTFEL